MISKGNDYLDGVITVVTIISMKVVEKITLVQTKFVRTCLDLSIEFCLLSQLFERKTPRT